MNRFAVKTPMGYLIVEEKGAEDEYPGVYISLSNTEEPDGSLFPDNMVACVEYDSYTGEIKTESYARDRDDPVEIIRYRNGNSLI